MTSSFDYDIAITFAGEDRNTARKIAKGLRREGVDVFFDEFKEEDIWVGGISKNQSICLRLGKHNIQRSENSYNEIITIEEMDNELWLNVMMGSLSFGHSKALKTKNDIAEYIWSGITRPLECLEK